MSIKKNKLLKSKDIVLSGIVLSINLLLLISINYIQSNTLFLMSLCSVLIAVVLIETNVKTAIVFSIASILLSFFILGNKIHFFVYSMIFSNYGVIKYIIESRHEIKIQYVLKLLYFCFISFLLLYFINILGVRLKYLFIPLIISLFFVYDYVFTLAIEYYLLKIRKVIYKNAPN